MDKVAAVFASYWSGGDFVPYDREEFLARVEGLSSSSGPKILLSPVEDAALGVLSRRRRAGLLARHV